MYLIVFLFALSNMNNSIRDTTHQANLTEMKQAMKLIVYKLVLARPEDPIEYMCQELRGMLADKQSVRTEYEEVFLTSVEERELS